MNLQNREALSMQPHGAGIERNPIAGGSHYLARSSQSLHHVQDSGILFYHTGKFPDLQAPCFSQSLISLSIAAPKLQKPKQAFWTLLHSCYIHHLNVIENFEPLIICLLKDIKKLKQISQHSFSLQ